MASVDDLANLVMDGLREYSELADTAMKKAVRKTAASVKKEISENAPKRTGRYAKSWTAKKTKETLIKSRLTALHAIYLQIFRHITQKLLAIRQYACVAFMQSDEKSDCVSDAQDLISVSLKKTATHWK